MALQWHTAKLLVDWHSNVVERILLIVNEAKNNKFRVHHSAAIANRFCNVSLQLTILLGLFSSP